MNELLTMVPLPVLVIIAVMIVISIIYMGYTYLKNRTLDDIRGDVYQLVLIAEHTYRESSSGKQKMKWVVSQARRLLPNWLQMIISEEMLQKIIQVWFNEIKEVLDDGQMNGSQKR